MFLKQFILVRCENLKYNTDFLKSAYSGMIYKSYLIFVSLLSCILQTLQLMLDQ
uniref:Uncharacterized protein n=1 Tax=Macrostomum lignano TaxID=282301 RepID=A0A1I8FC83_9PLAT